MMQQFWVMECNGVMTYQSGQCHSCDRTDQFDGGSVMDVAVSHRKFFRLAFIVIHCKQNIVSKKTNDNIVSYQPMSTLSVNNECQRLQTKFHRPHNTPLKLLFGTKAKAIQVVNIIDISGNCEN